MAELLPSNSLLGQGWKCLGGEYVTTYGTAKALVTKSKIPQNTRWAQITVRAATLVITFDGTTPTASVGNDYGASTTPYVLNLDAKEIEKLKGYSAGAATLYITYFGNK